MNLVHWLIYWQHVNVPAESLSNGCLFMSFILQIWSNKLVTINYFCIFIGTRVTVIFLGTNKKINCGECRLLRNRVSAQQARERKKAYLSELEVRVKELEKKNTELEERLSTLQNENQMLRHVCQNSYLILYFYILFILSYCHPNITLFLLGLYYCSCPLDQSEISFTR